MPRAPSWTLAAGFGGLNASSARRRRAGTSRRRQDFRDRLALVPLNLDPPVLHRAAAAAGRAHLLGQRFLLRQADAHKAVDHGHRLAAPPLRSRAEMSTRPRFFSGTGALAAAGDSNGPPSKRRAAPAALSRSKGFCARPSPPSVGNVGAVRRSSAGRRLAEALAKADLRAGSRRNIRRSTCGKRQRLGIAPTLQKMHQLGMQGSARGLLPAGCFEAAHFSGHSGAVGSLNAIQQRS